MNPPSGCSVATTKLGATYLRMHYSADPQKDAVWAAEERAKTPLREWEREMEMNEDVYDGESVYGGYVDRVHCPWGVKSELPIALNSFYIGGWDCGTTRNPAFVLIQVTPKPYQIQAILEVLPPSPESMDQFAPRVLRALIKRLPGHWDTVRHYCDLTLTTKSGATEQSAKSVAKTHGFNLKPAYSQSVDVRIAAVEWALTDMIDEKTPRLVIDGVNCPVLREGFKGAYRMEDNAKSEGVGAGRMLNQPLKNRFSDIQDALQYGTMTIRQEMFKPGQQSRSMVG